MEKRIVPFSACSARLLGSVASLKFSLLTISQLTPDETSRWAQELNTQLGEKLLKLDISSMIEGARKDGKSAAERIKFSMLINTIISFSSTTEYFLKDIIRLCLKRSSKLRMNAFSKFEISALMLEDNSSLNEIKVRLIKRLSSEYSKGGLFKDKITKASKFLLLDPSWQDKQKFEFFDSVFAMRNHIAHNNTVYLDKIALQFITGEITLNRNASKEEFTNFSGNFIESLNSSYDYLNNWCNLCLDKWHADEFIDVDA